MVFGAEGGEKLINSNHYSKVTIFRRNPRCRLSICGKPQSGVLLRQNPFIFLKHKPLDDTGENKRKKKRLMPLFSLLQHEYGKSAFCIGFAG